MSRQPLVHDVKSWTFLFEPMLQGIKTHDIRVMDRDYQIGDLLCLREYDFGKKTYTGRCAYRTITYITSADSPCAFSHTVLHPKYAVLSVRPISVTDPILASEKAA